MACVCQTCGPDSTSPNYTVHCKGNEEPSPCESSTIGLSMVYNGLRSFKDKIIKTVQSVPVSRRFLKRTKVKCVTSIQQGQTCLSQKKEKKRRENSLIEFDKRIENDVSKCIEDISEESENAKDVLFASDASAQIKTTICTWRQENGENSDYPPCRKLKNNTRLGPLSITSDDGSVVDSDRITGESPKNRVMQTLLKNKLKKYKKCSCGVQCPYALYKLPCDKYKRGTLKERADDESGELTLECLSFGEKSDFPKFVAIDARRRERNDARHFADFGTDELSSTSSLSVDLEVNVCSDYGNRSGTNVDEFSKRRKARTYTVNRMSVMRNDAVDRFETKTELSSNVISSWKSTSGKKKKIDEMIEVSYLSADTRICDCDIVVIKRNITCTFHVTYTSISLLLAHDVTVTLDIIITRNQYNSVF